MIGGMMPLPASAEETVSENIVQTECIENTENLENAPSEDEKSSETDHETGSETESETVTDAETEGTAISAIQALIDALPDADSITEDNVENVTSQLDTIDEAKAELSDADMSQLDLTRYDAAINKVMVLMGMKEENDSEIAVQANDSAGKTEQQSTDEAIVYQPAVETTDKYDIDDDGTKDTVYEISNAGQLYWFAGLVNGTLDGVEQNTLANAILTANISVNENLLDSLQYDTEGNVSNGSDFITWTPIADWMGNRTTQYSGTFDGNNKTVSGLYFNGDSTCIGLFGSSESDGNIKNVGVVDSYFKGNDYVGGVCGNNAGTITNCYNAGNLTAIESSAAIGGICGYNNGGTVTNCYNTGTVTATGSVASVGGVCGCSIAPISNCYNIGTVTATSSSADISGICGYNYGPIKNCYYLADTEDENGGKTTAQFASGEVAYLLSQGCTVGVGEDAVTYSGSIWGQKLGENGDTYPVLDITKRVYQVDKYDGCEGKPGSSTKVYSNQSTSIYEEHKYEADATDSTKHKCSICNGIEEHSFAYELVENGNAIKATCSECGATYTVKLTQPAATSDEKIVYDGTEKKAGTAIDSGNTGIETIPENAITYAVVTNGTPSTYSTAAPKNAGTYKAKLTLGTGDNRVSIEINFTIEKAASPTIAGEEKSYAYSAGSGGKAIGVDIAGKLPTDRGTTTYAVAETDTEQLLSEVTVDAAGNLTYKVNQVDSSKVGKTAIITVTASMENYENVEYTLTIRSITDKKTVEIKRGNTVSVDGSNVLTYGEKISKLTLGNTVFVEAGTDNMVEGILSWSNPDEVPATGTTQAGWVFKPTDSKHYEDLTGTAAITVAKATPIVVTVPTVAEREYNPDAALTGSDMTGGSVTGADGNSLAGTWSFTGTNIVPTVNNTGYQAVFTPNDTNNYNTVTRTITVKVTKATPVIAEKPTAGALTYGQKLSDSTLTGGKAAYQTADGTEIKGTFAWKNDTTKPAVVDSQKTEYDVTFTPSDKDNYNAVDTKLTLSINKAAAPTMQPIELTVINGLAKTYLVNLPALPTLGDNCKYGSIKYEACNFNLIGEGGYANSTAMITSNDEFQLTVPAVESQTEGSVGTVGVKITTDNYQDMLLTVEVIAKNKIVPVLDGEITAAPITFGQILRVSTITGTMKDDGKTVEGTFEWTDPSTKPDKAGDYQAEWTFTPAEGYEEYATATGTVTVKVKPAKLTVSVKASRAYYNGEAQIASIIASGQSVDSTPVTFTYSDKVDGNYTSGGPTFTDAGTYTAYYKAEAANHEPATGTFTVTIDPLPIRLLSVSSISKSYDGSADVTLTADKLTFFSKTASRQDITLPNTALTFSDAQFTSKQEDGSYLPSPEVGNGKALSFTMTLTSNNYVFEGKSEGTTEVSDVFATDDVNRFTITKAAAPTDIQTGTLNVVNGTKLEYTYDAKQLLPKAPKGTYGKVSYNCEFPFNLKNGYYVDDIAIKDSILTLTIDALNGGETGKIGTIPVYVTTDNYASFNLPLDLYAVNKITPVADGEITAAGITYGDALSKSTISGKMKDPNTGATVNGTFAWTDGTTKPDANDNYEAEWTFTPAASHEKYATVTGTVTVKVNKATPTFNAPTAQENLTYTGQEQALITAGSVKDYGPTMQYSLTENGTYSQNIPTGTDAGTYTVYYKVVGDKNHNDTAPASVTVRIGQKPLTITGVTVASKSYDGTTNADISSVTFDNVTLNQDTDYTVTASFDDAGVGNDKNVTATVTLRGQAAKNYALEQSSFTTTGSITKAAAPGSGLRPAVTVINDLAKTYEMVLSNDYLPKLSPPCEYGNVSYSLRGTYLTDGYKNMVQAEVVEENGQYKLKLTVPAVDYNKVSSVGTIDVRVTSDNYRDFYLTIGVKTKNKDVPVPDGTISASDITYGQALNDSKIAGKMKAGGKAIDGTFTWTNGTFKPAAGDYSASWTFTPAKGYEEYSTATGTATVTVDPKAVTVRITPNGGTYGSVTAAAAVLSGVVDGETVPVTLTYTGTANDGTAYADTTPPAKAGTYTITATTTNPNYTLDPKTTTADFTIAKRPATVTPDNKSKVYQEKDPDLTYKVDGVLDGETLKGITLTRAEGENVGEYAITAAADVGANPNYEVTFAEGKFTIDPKSIDGATVKLGKGLAANGAEQTQTVEKVLLDDKEIPADSYTVAGNTATAHGIYTLTITAKGNYTDSIAWTYVIAPSKAEDAPGEEITIGSGKVKVDVKSEGAVPSVGLLTDKAELLAMLVDSGDITADELAQIAYGASVDIVLTVKEANAPDEVKTAMAQAAKDYTIGQYLDISLFKYMTVNGSQQAGVALHTTKDELTISVVVPDTLINTNSAVNRTYCIVRNHEGTITVLDAAFNAASKTLTFKTDHFSDYAIAYKDTAVPSSGSNPGSNNSSNGSETKKNEVAAPTPAPTPASTSKPSTITAMPQTGDTSNPTLYVVLLVASLLGLAVVFVCKKRNDK